VDRIHIIWYLNFVMSSWCLSDLPVSGQVTAFAISGKMMTSLVVLKWRNNDFPDLLFQPSYLGTHYVAAEHCVAPCHAVFVV
jgi:hypothetical protein